MLKVAIAGATGYTGAELMRILVRHPKVEVVCVTSEQSAGELLTSRLPFLQGLCNLTLEKLEPEHIAQKADLIFSALSHTKAMQPVSQWIASGKRVIDLSADYRLHTATTYEKWYHAPHLYPDLLKEAVYGLPEIYRQQIGGRAPQDNPRLIANPGCYPTATLLPLYPYLKAGVVDTARTIIIDAKSGLSGAGRTATDVTHFPQINEGFSAYNIGTHRHIPEIEQEVAPYHAQLIFTPYLLPVNRGIFTTIYLPLQEPLTQTPLELILQKQYNQEPFIRLLSSSPNLNNIKGSNFCDIAVFATSDPKTAILMSALDNLVKGAAGQAIQNMNIMMGWDEQEGLIAPGFFP